MTTSVNVDYAIRCNGLSRHFGNYGWFPITLGEFSKDVTMPLYHRRAHQCRWSIWRHPEEFWCYGERVATQTRLFNCPRSLCRLLQLGNKTQLREGGTLITVHREGMSSGDSDVWEAFSWLARTGPPGDRYTFTCKAPIPDLQCPSNIFIHPSTIHLSSMGLQCH